MEANVDYFLRNTEILEDGYLKAIEFYTIHSELSVVLEFNVNNLTQLR